MWGDFSLEDEVRKRKSVRFAVSGRHDRSDVLWSRKQSRVAAAVMT